MATKVYVVLEDGLIQSVLSNTELEVIVINNDVQKDEPTNFGYRQFHEKVMNETADLKDYY